MNHPRRLLAVVAACVLLFAGGAACEPAPGTPAELLPLPEIPPPPNLEDTELAPQVTITQRDRETVEEARVNGILMWIRVTPRHGRPYYLIPTAGGNMFIRRDSLDTALKVPMWVLFSW